MIIGIVYAGGYPWNRGIDQLAQSLRCLGHEPLIVARLPESNEKVNLVNDIPVIHVPLNSDNLLRNLQVFPFPFNPFWRNWLINLGRKFNWQGIIVRETPLSWSVLSAARKLGIPAYLDMRENLAAMYQIGQARNWILRIMRNPNLIKLYERSTIRSFDYIFTVSEELKEWLIATYATMQQKISVLENTPHEHLLQAAERALEKTHFRDGIVRLVYAGTIKESKGIGDVIYSMTYVVSQCPQVRLRIIGDGPGLEQMKKLVWNLNLENKVEFMPMLSMPNLAKALAECDIGVESCWLNKLTHQTLPGKLFEYMALGLPILSSARRPVVRILNDVRCGRVYSSREPQQIADSILAMIANQTALREMGQRARKAVLERYNWRFTLDSLRKGLALYENMSDSKKSGTLSRRL